VSAVPFDEQPEDDATRPIVSRVLLPLREDDPASIGEYRLTHRLPGGNSDTVKYLGKDGRGVPVVLKVLPDGANDTVRQRLEREVAAATRVRSRRVARVLGTGSEGDLSYMVQEFAPGRPLSELVPSLPDRRLGESDGLRLAVGLLLALRDVHAAELIHSDPTPANSIVGNRWPVLVDLGSSQPFGREQVELSGTPFYVSPEQARGEQIDWRSDIFVWALTVVFAVTGRRAFDPAGRYSARQYEDRIAAVPPQLNGVPPQLLEAVRLALAPRPADRPPIDRLLELLQGNGVTETLQPYTRVLHHGDAPVIPLAPTPLELLQWRHLHRLLQAYWQELLLRLGSSWTAVGAGAVAAVVLGAALALVVRTVWVIVT
jgi:serine/threonine protein kinase